MKQQNNSKKEHEYNLSADVLRVLAISGVVIIHTANAVFARPDFFGGISWWFAIILNSLARVSIPLFIMISGYFILTKYESLTNTLKRTFHRILIPLVFWFLVYMIWNGGRPTLAIINRSFIYRFLTVNVFDLYFLVILLGLYCVSPFLRALFSISNYATQKIIVFILLALGACAYATQYSYYLCSKENIWTYWVPYVGLFVAGYFFGKNTTQFKKKYIFITYVISLAITVGLGYLYYDFHNHSNYLLESHGCLTYYSDSYLSINVIIMSLCAFILLMGTRFTLSPIIRRILYSIARVTLGIYLLHTIIITILDSDFHLFDRIAPAWLYIIIKWFVIFILSYLFAYLLVKVPLIKKVFGENK